jgi:hypothetical protein
MNTTPNDFDEFFSLINTTAERQIKAYHVKTKGYIPTPSDHPKKKYKPKPRKKNNTRPNTRRILS